jgi:membrane associated rhomboid family serine protease
MRENKDNQFNLSNTPSVIRKLLGITLAVSLGAAIFDPLFAQIFKLPGPETLLSLSRWGMNHYLYFQPLTALFVQDSGLGVTMGWILSLGMNLYILWIFGTSVLEWTGTRSFLKLYLGSGITAAIATFVLMVLTGGYQTISGAYPATLAVLFVWTMMHPEGNIFLFMLIPVSSRWLFGLVFGAFTLFNLNDFYFLFYMSAGLFFGYLFALLGWGFQSPYRWLKKVDQFLLKFKKPAGTKIYSFKTGEELSDDEAFVDAMLKKISQKGEGSLSSKEKRRLDAIALKKRGHF